MVFKSFMSNNPSDKSFFLKILKKYFLLFSGFLFGIIVILINLFIYSKANIQTINQIEITDNLKGDYVEDLKRNLQIQKDIRQNLEFYDILKLENNNINPFVHVRSNIISLGFVSHPIWFKISLSNKTNEEVKLKLLSSYPLLDFIECYVVDKSRSNVNVFYKGDRYEFKTDNNLFNRNSFFNLDIQPNDQIDVYLMIKSESTLVASLFLFSETKFLTNNRIVGIFQGGFFFILLFLIFIQFFLFYLMRIKTILFYILYHICFLLFMFFSSDLPIIFFTKWYKFSNEIVILSISLVYYSIIFLSINLLNSLLNVLQNYLKLIKNLKFIFYFLFLSFFIVLISSFMTTTKFLYFFRAFNFLFTNLILIVFIIFLAKKEVDILIVYFYAGWLWGITGIFLATFVNLGFIKEIISYFPYIYFFSSVEFIIVTIGILHKFKNIYQNEREITIRLNNELKKKNFYQKSINKKLIYKLTQNNKKLTNINRKLKNSLENLKKNQEQLIQSEKMLTVGLMSSAIAHEIKNPLNFIKSYNSLMGTFIEQITDIFTLINNKEDRIDSEIKTYIENLKIISEKINLGVDRILLLINHFKKFMSSEEEEKIEEFDIVYCIESALLSLPYTFLRDIDVKRDYLDLFTVRGSKGLLKQAFINLFINSIHAMNFKGIMTIKIFVSGNLGKIHIIDSGEGISKEIKSKIFEPFFTTKEGKGTGLGLPIALNILKKHKGDIILVESRSGYTCFEINLKIS